MSKPYNLGQTGEEKAALYLTEKGYRILQRNWKAGKFEIDIIAETSDFIVFAEVKTRSDNYLVNPSDSVTSVKQRSIIFAADTFLKRYDIDKESRFDIITVIKKGDTYQIEHIEDAFYPTLR